jgi:hypothetical protein
MPDIVTTAFLTLRNRFFDSSGQPVPFDLRDKRNTQDDPLDEMLATVALAGLVGIRCEQASGPLITPDMVLYRPDACHDVAADSLTDALDSIVGLEIKKLERTKQGTVARTSGLDYNTTPPCGRVRVYDRDGAHLDIRGFYLFVCVEPAGDGQVAITALTLVDGNLLNADFELYLSIVGQRVKRIGLGTYGDGADRARPMLIFANPLRISELTRGACLIHPADDLATGLPALRRVFLVNRSLPEGGARAFFGYRSAADAIGVTSPVVLDDPFPTPARRSERTSPRGRFRLSFRLP